MTPFKDPFDHLQAELKRLDLLLHVEKARLETAAGIRRRPGTSPDIGKVVKEIEDLRQTNIARVGKDLPWAHCAREFQLDEFELDTLLLALAPEIDRAYDDVFAYLNGNPARTSPTIDLALRLFVADKTARFARRERLSSQATLFRAGLLKGVVGSSTTELASGFAISPTALYFICGRTTLDPQLARYADVVRDQTEWDSVPGTESSVRLRNLNAAPAVLILEGQEGSGRRLAAEAFCRDRNLHLLDIDASKGLDTLRPLLLWQRLHRGALFFRGIEYLTDLEIRKLGPELRELTLPVFIAGPPGFRWNVLLQQIPWLSFEFDVPEFPERRRLWDHALKNSRMWIEARGIDDLASRFVLRPAQIANAIRVAQLEVRPSTSGKATLAALAKASRSQSTADLGRFAVKVEAAYSWDDLVLPQTTMDFVKEVETAIRHRHTVFSLWGFDRKAGNGPSVTALFSGPSGTGKTMAAGTIGRDLELDVYRIDLSAVVSKYIGETEKNLDSIFRAAQSSSAILFFDEADALFGKRSEVKDAHDRYANIEVAYLLQKIEEHSGAVILATNLSGNIDEAFSRRVHYVVEFPLPDEVHREKLWRRVFPPQLPLSTDVDLVFLAKQFPVSGGDIRNIALNAAFLAAQNGHVVTMEYIIRAVARQMTKQGKVPSASSFKQYHGMTVHARSRQG